jgi:hypothetical protein
MDNDMNDLLSRIDGKKPREKTKAKIVFDYKPYAESVLAFLSRCKATVMRDMEAVRGAAQGRRKED